MYFPQSRRKKSVLISAILFLALLSVEKYKRISRKNVRDIKIRQHTAVDEALIQKLYFLSIFYSQEETEKNTSSIYLNKISFDQRIRIWYNCSNNLRFSNERATSKRFTDKNTYAIIIKNVQIEYLSLFC